MGAWPSSLFPVVLYQLPGLLMKSQMWSSHNWMVDFLMDSPVEPKVVKLNEKLRGHNVVDSELTPSSSLGGDMQ